MRRNLLAVLFALLVAARGAAAAERPEILIFAAASLSESLAEAGHAFEASGGAHVSFNFGASNDLARQIEAGAPAAAFVSANRAQVERLEKSGHVRPGDWFALLGNVLVVVAPRDGAAAAVAGARDLLRFERLALADPAAVPAGVYAKAWLEQAGVWKEIAPRVVPALDVRAALAAVAAGNLPAGIVYATDAASTDRVRVLYRVPAAATPDLRYYAAAIAPASPDAAAFLAFLKGPQASQIFTRYGFLVLTPAGKP